uniref:GH16 domain-containing protein n=1 Tax=Strigamia maritima TaxID=126957 RepID=T1J6Q0_STRMM
MKLFLVLFNFLLANANEWELIWQDNFDHHIDTQNWVHEIGDGCPNICGWGNNELQYYTDSSSNSYVQGGHLVIQAKKENLHNKEYTSARMITKGKAQWRYGKFEISAKLPKGSGIWPAIWMLPVNNILGDWPRSGEIDIMELLGQEPSIAHCTAHYGNSYNDKGQKSTSYNLATGSFSDDFHLYEIIWNEDKITWYIDGNKVQEVINGQTPPYTYPFNSDDFFLILNVAVGGYWPGSPKDDTTFPVKMEVDYIRIYRNKNSTDTSNDFRGTSHSLLDWLKLLFIVGIGLVTQ